MKLLANRLFWGAMLIVGGVLFLLENLGVFEGGELFWGVILFIAGVLFLGVYFGERRQWWALIPGMVLLSIGALILLSTFIPGFNEALGGMLLLVGMGLGFIFVYLANHAHWWAIIPGGVLVSIGVVAGLSDVVSDERTAGILLLGFALTFLAVALAPSPVGRMRWALIPAAVLAVIGLLIFVGFENAGNYIVALALIIVGGVLVWRSLRTRRDIQP
jgi:hypothetical protein